MSFDALSFDALSFEEFLNKETQMPTFKYRPKINEEGNETYNLNGLDEHWYRTVANNFTFMLPTDLTYLHKLYIKWRKELLTAYTKEKIESNRDIHNKLKEYFNILIMIKFFLKRNEAQIEHGVKVIHNNHDFEFEINDFLTDLNNYKKYAKTQIDRINADILKENNEKSLLISSYNYELESYNYKLKKTLWYESIYNEVLKRLHP